MTKQFLIAIAALPTLGIAQSPPSPLAAATYSAQTTFSGRIMQFNYGPDGRVSGILVFPNNLIVLPPGWAAQMESAVKPGQTARVTGSASPGASAMQIVRPQSIAVAGKVFRDVQPPPEPEPSRGASGGGPGRGPGNGSPPPPLPGASPAPSETWAPAPPPPSPQTR